ncbi:MAG: Fmu (Sun) domain protein [Chitinophagaceae bacterium]
MNSLADVKGFDKEAFAQVHASGEQITSIRFNPAKPVSQVPNFPISLAPIPWTNYGFYLSQRPSFTFDPLFHAGCYYVQEASSMFLEQALRQTVDLSRPMKLLDLSAAPGGKSTHLQSLITADSLLVSNEVIKSRAAVLKDNIIKWGSDNVMVTCNDPSHFARLPGYFDVLVADAPCSGSGLFRRDPEAIGEWSLNSVQLCSQRQQRILADAWPALKENGVLIYSTCSYSREEDEDILDWLEQELKAESLQLAVPAGWNIVEVQGRSGAYGYRFWPDKVKGEGFFIACLRKTSGGQETRLKLKNKPEVAGRTEAATLGRWMQTEGYDFIKHEQTVYAWPAALTADLSILLQQLRVVYSGVRAGELLRDKLVPDHALALSGLVNDAIGRTPLTNEEAILYLQRKDLPVRPAAAGWQLVTCEGQPLGWINALPNRINNYYPKELRILRDN